MYIFMSTNFAMSSLDNQKQHKPIGKKWNISKITRRTLGAHGNKLLLNELSFAIVWYNMLSNIRYHVSSFAISCYIVLFDAFLFFSGFLMLSV